MKRAGLKKEISTRDLHNTKVNSTYLHDHCFQLSGKSRSYVFPAPEFVSLFTQQPAVLPSKRTLQKLTISLQQGILSQQGSLAA